MTLPGVGLETVTVGTSDASGVARHMPLASGAASWYSRLSMATPPSWLPSRRPVNMTAARVYEGAW